MDEQLLNTSLRLFEIICVIAVFAVFIIRSRFFTEILEHRPRAITSFIFVLFYGLVSIVGTVTGIGLFGSIGNVRDIGPMMAGLTCGPVIGLGAGIIGGVFRFLQGGPYQYTGLSAPILCGLLGGVLFIANNREFVHTRVAVLYMALCDTFISIYTLTLVTPPNQRLIVTEQIAIPMIVGSTIGVFLFSTFIHAQIAERKKEIELRRLERENEERKNLDAIINTLADPVFLIDQNSCWALVNDQFCQFIGKSREEIVNKPIIDSFPLEEYQEIINQTRDVRQNRAPNEREMKIRGANREYSTIISKSSIYVDSGGNDFIVCILRDISERKKMEEAIFESEARLNSVLQGSPLMQFVIDRDHRVISWNKAIETFSSIPASEIIGKNDHWRAFYKSWHPMLVDILVDDDKGELDSRIEKGLKRARYLDGAYEGTTFFPDMGRTGKWIYYSAAPIRNKRGEIIGAVETLEEITERKRIDAALKLTLKKLKLLSSITRHDILNKLTILSGALFLLSEKISDAEGLEQIQLATRTTRIIQRQIAFTREYEELGVKEPIWQGLHDVISTAAREVTISPVSIEIAPTRLEVFADPLFIKVFLNLFENARMHGDHLTKIRVGEMVTDAGVVITVSDNGEGVPVEDKDLIFEQGFGRNTGHGLFLSREILDITGIAIREIGVPGNGAIFEIMVPNCGYRVTDV